MLTPCLQKSRILFLIHGKTKVQSVTVRVTQPLTTTTHNMIFSPQKPLVLEVSGSSSVSPSQHHSVTATPQLWAAGHCCPTKPHQFTSQTEVWESHVSTSHCKATHEICWLYSLSQNYFQIFLLLNLCDKGSSRYSEMWEQCANTDLPTNHMQGSAKYIVEKQDFVRFWTWNFLQCFRFPCL